MHDRERTQVAIVGAGPAGLLLGRQLSLAGVDTVILEARSRAYVEARVRAGMLEDPTVELLDDIGLGARLRREGAVHTGFELRFGGRRHRVAMSDLTGGCVTVMYGQQEIVKDAVAARVQEGAPLRFEAADVRLDDLDTSAPTVRFAHDGREHELRCDFVVGCDGFHGVARPSIPAARLTSYSALYPFAWLGVLAEVPPACEELVYAAHDRGFSLHSMRSPTLSRFYLQVGADESLDAWPPERIWAELRARLATEGEPPLQEGPIVQQSITAMRSFVCEPMRHGRLLLAGDAAHVVPPTAAKGLNLAAGDARLLADALTEWYAGRTEPLERYSDVALRRVWWAQQFSREMTWLLHHDGDDSFAGRLKLAQLEHLVSSEDAATAFCRQYVGLPFARAVA